MQVQTQVQAQVRAQVQDNSYFWVRGTFEELKPITERLKVQRPDAYFNKLVQMGIQSAYEEFYETIPGALKIPLGFAERLKDLVQVPSEIPGIPNEPVPNYLHELQKYLGSLNLPWTPYRHQMWALMETLQRKIGIFGMCTGSGKSLTISLFCDFMRTKGMKGLLVVPNINLLQQFKSDIKDYNLLELYENTFTIGGGQNVRDFSFGLTISTWQSLQDFKDSMQEFDYIVVDEGHKSKAKELKDMITLAKNAKYKLAFTGTINVDPIDRMTLIGLFGEPKTYITTSELIQKGLGTELVVNALKLQYSEEDKLRYRQCNNHHERLGLIKEHENRTNFICTLANSLTSENPEIHTGNTLVLYQHTEHGKKLFSEVLKKKHPEVQEVQNKDIVGKHSLEFQRKHGVYYISGEIKPKNRELIREELEKTDNVIVVANYEVLGTGVNIKNLHNIILASPIKSFITISQSIGRGIRLHKNKTTFEVFDICDMFTPKCRFMKQYEERKTLSYEPQSFKINERVVLLGS